MNLQSWILLSLVLWATLAVLYRGWRRRRQSKGGCHGCSQSQNCQFRREARSSREARCRREARSCRDS